MPIRIRCCGAAGQVTGSGYLIETPSAKLLVDFGLFAGERNADELNRSLGFLKPDELDAVLVTHAHVDHTGRLPLLTAHGLRAPIWATPATIDIGAILLEDSARIQASEYERAMRYRRGQGAVAATEKAALRDVPEPLYSVEDVENVLSHMKKIGLNAPTEVANGVTARYLEAGHILGSASIELTVRVPGGERRLVFSGDLGPRGSPILHDAMPPTEADLVVLESTYGDRDHPSREETFRTFVDALRTAIWEHRKVIIPAFAVGRTQTILYVIAEAIRAGTLPQFPIYIDSPMGAKVTEVYAHHRDLYDAEASTLAHQRQLEKDLRYVRVVETIAESKSLNTSRESCLIIAGSGMCEGGRVVHHLRHSLGDSRVTVLLVGFMAEGTLGREIRDGNRVVEVLGDEVEVRAKVVEISGLSAHAGQSDLLWWVDGMAKRKPTVVLTHGEDPQRAALHAKLAERYGVDARRPTIGEPIELA
ncbi:MAG: MBL fold metallo-hydrolase [Phycisphaerae bacterium]|nr:MBL fold metallo-hydrolase [Phycisphaerae bacterium]